MEPRTDEGSARRYPGAAPGVLVRRRRRPARYGERFHRRWRYLPMSSAGTFRARHLQLWQIVMSPPGIVGGYREIR